MPKDKSGKYASTADLPDPVKNALPAHGQAIFRAAYNSAVDEGKDEQTGYQIAWAAVSKGGYTKGKDGKWTRPADWKPKDGLMQNSETSAPDDTLYRMGERLKAAVGDVHIWTDEMDLIQRAFEMQHPLDVGQVRLVSDSSDVEYEIVVHFARTLEQKGIGWLGMTDEAASGVLFVEPGDSLRAFHNGGVDATLDLWTFGAAGELLEHFELAAGNPTAVRPTKYYRWALELERGCVAELAADAQLLLQ